MYKSTDGIAIGIVKSDIFFIPLLKKYVFKILLKLYTFDIHDTGFVEFYIVLIVFN